MFLLERKKFAYEDKPYRLPHLGGGGGGNGSSAPYRP